MEEIREEYRKLNDELRMLLFSIEKVCGLGQGDGEVFSEVRKIREVVDARHIFCYIAIKYLEYSHQRVRNWMGMNYTSNVTYAIGRVDDLIRYNVAYRNRVYNVAVECGIVPLINYVVHITKK